MFWWTLGKTGYSDSESIGGSLESLSSPGKHKPAFVPFWFTFIWKSCKDKHVWFPLYCVFALLECIIEAHTNRRLPKTTSTLTISSDDPDDRDVASESGLLLPFYASINRILLKSTWPNPPHGNDSILRIHWWSASQSYFTSCTDTPTQEDEEQDGQMQAVWQLHCCQWGGMWGGMRPNRRRIQ